MITLYLPISELIEVQKELPIGHRFGYTALRIVQACQIPRTAKELRDITHTQRLAGQLNKLMEAGLIQRMDKGIYQVCKWKPGTAVKQSFGQ